MTRWETLLSPDGSSMQAQPATKATSHGETRDGWRESTLGQCHELLGAA